MRKPTLIDRLLSQADQALRVSFAAPAHSGSDPPGDECDGALDEAARASWRARLERMTLLRAAAGEGAERMTSDLLACLAHPGHRTTARVHAVLARRPG